MFKKSESESGIGKNQDPEQIFGFGMNNPDYISESSNNFSG
jgi:hypothetical protein